MITNYLSPVSFLVTVERLPNVEFFTQRATIPSLSMAVVPQPNPLANIYSTPDRIEYSDLDLSFIVDEGMKNYREILAWMEGMGTPQTSDQYRSLKASKSGVTSDITLIIQNSSRNPSIKVTYTNCFPTSLSPVSLSVTETDIVYPECTATFRYDNMIIEDYS